MKCHYANTDKKIEKRKEYYYNNREKFIDIEKNRRDIHENEIERLKSRNQKLTQAMENWKSIISVS